MGIDGGGNQGKGTGQAEQKRMMYKGGRFARGRVENERNGAAWCDTHFTWQKREKERRIE